MKRVKNKISSIIYKEGILQIKVPPEADGTRVDVFLAATLRQKDRQNLQELHCVEITRSAAQKLLSGQRVRVGVSDKGESEASVRDEHGFRCIGKNYRVQAGELVICEIPEPIPSEAVAESIPINIVYEDDFLLVVNKPRGLVVHPGAGNPSGTLVNALLYHCELSGIGGVLRPGIVHRLDKDTSGLMVVAKTDFAHQNLAAQLESRTMGREYNALCVGVLKKDGLKLDLPIGRHPRERKKMAVLAQSRSAITNIKVLERFKNHTLVSARLETGRTHQIRVHMAHIGHPVLGDKLYGNPKPRPPFDTGGQILHAIKLRFVHPHSGEILNFTAPLPDYFQNAIDTIRPVL